MAENGDAGHNGHCSGFTEGIERSWGLAMAFEGYPILACMIEEKSMHKGASFEIWNCQCLVLSAACTGSSHIRRRVGLRVRSCCLSFSYLSPSLLNLPFPSKLKQKRNPKHHFSTDSKSCLHIHIAQNRNAQPRLLACFC
jgi:hypothetical protein